MFLYDYVWYRRWAGGAWISYFVDGIAGPIHEPVEGATFIAGHMHGVAWEYYPPARRPIENKWEEPDR